MVSPNFLRENLYSPVMELGAEGYGRSLGQKMGGLNLHEWN